MKRYQITVNGNVYDVTVEEIEAAAQAAVAPVQVQAPLKAEAKPAAKPAAGSTPVTSPMPGTILDIKCKPGDTVKRGQALFILEAMKMENEIPAPCDGVVASVEVTKGATVETGSLLASLK